MRFLYLFVLVIAGAATIGTATAATFNENVDITGRLQVVNGGFIFDRSDGVQTAMQLKNPTHQSTFSFTDPDDFQTYILRSTPGTSGTFDFLDFSGVSPVPRVDLTIDRSSGNIGVGKTGPTEQLDVDGNIKLSGNILSNGDICIGAC